MSLQQWPTDLLRDFSNSNRRTEMDPTRMDIDSRTMARSHRFLKDDWHFSWCWPWVPLSIFMPAAACFVHGRVTRDDISHGRNISRVPTTFSRNKIADIERETKRPARRCKFHANLRLSVNSSAFTTASVRSQGIENSLPFREILRTSFIVCYLFLRDK